MAEDDQRQKETASPHEGAQDQPTGALSTSSDQTLVGTTEDEGELVEATQLGSARYVMAGFFVAGIFLAFIIGKALSSAWETLVELLWVQKNFLIFAQVGEEQRAEYSTVVGGIASLFLTVYFYRRTDVREWTEGVADELAKVTWPDKAEVTGSTITVLVASAFATLYLALLDRVWGFLTNLVYGG